ncbi:hypothetical protein TKK_0014464 [Trichogramma kaykai]
MEFSGKINNNNFVAKVKEETNEFCNNENDCGEIENQSSDSTNLQYLRSLQENTMDTNDKCEDHTIKVEFECKDVKPNVNLLVFDKVNEKMPKFQPNLENKVEFECKDAKPNVNLLVLDKVNEGIHEFQPNQEIKIDFECKDVKPKLNLLTFSQKSNLKTHIDSVHNTL